MENSKISWTHHTYSSWLGCSFAKYVGEDGKTHTATGCLSCYAKELVEVRFNRAKWGEGGTRSKTKTAKDVIKWNKRAKEFGVKEKVFCASLSDVFEERDELISWRQELFELIDKCQNLYWLLLTKRPWNIKKMWPDNKNRANVWLGTSVACQKETDPFINPLLEVKGLCKYLFLSVEPQIGLIDLKKYLFPTRLLDWCIFGGESKQGALDARPYDMEWTRFSIKQCCQAGVACFIKQMGYNVYDNGVKVHLKDTGHGKDMSEWPEDLRVQECPETYYSACEK